MLAVRVARACWRRRRSGGGLRLSGKQRVGDTVDLAVDRIRYCVYCVCGAFAVAFVFCRLLLCDVYLLLFAFSLLLLLSTEGRFTPEGGTAQYRCRCKHKRMQSQWRQRQAMGVRC